jgi:hypothetical protein
MNQLTGTSTHSIICPRCGRPYYYIGSPTAAPPLCQCGQNTFKGPDTFGWPFFDYKTLADEIAKRLRGIRWLGFDDERKCCICGRDGEAETTPGEFVAPGIRLGYGSTEGDGEYVCSDCLYGALDPLVKQAREAQPAPAPAAPSAQEDV